MRGAPRAWLRSWRPRRNLLGRYSPNVLSNYRAHLRPALRLNALLERVHNVDDLRRRLSFFLDCHLWRTLLDLGAEIFLQSHGEIVRHRLRLELARLFGDEFDGERLDLLTKDQGANAVETIEAAIGRLQKVVERLKVKAATPIVIAPDREP